MVFYILVQIRNQKAAQRKSLSSSVKELTLKGNPQQLKWFDFGKKDLMRAGHIQNVKILTNEKQEDLPQISLILDKTASESIYQLNFEVFQKKRIYYYLHQRERVKSEFGFDHKAAGRRSVAKLLSEFLDLF